MPFCTQCGNEAGPQDRFCSKCGAPQAVPPGAATGAAAPQSDVLRNVSPRTATVLCYVPFVGWIFAIVALASPRFEKDANVRFHAFQGIYLFVAWLLVDWVIAPLLRHAPSPGILKAMAWALQAAVMLAWVWMLVRCSQDRTERLPIIGEIAERSVAEQR